MLMRRIVPGFIVAFAMAAFVKFYPSPESDYPELYQAYTAIRSMCAPVNLEKSAFPYVYPDGQPSDWVSFAFSSLGTAEWPPRVGMEFTRQEALVARVMVLPEDVEIVPLRPRANFQKQLVLSFDDIDGVVIAEAYEAWNEDPVFQREWSVPQVSPSALAIETAESNLEMGLTYATDFDTWGSEWDEFDVWEDSSP